MIRQKRTRLKSFSYVGSYRYFITITTNRRKPYLGSEKLIGELKGILSELSERKYFLIWAYCFMPDHLHLLIEGNSENSDMREFIGQFKQASAYFFKRRNGERLWQENYYEHVLRKEEDTKIIAKYLLENPVRKGFVPNFQEYPYLGSLVFDVRDFG